MPERQNLRATGDRIEALVEELHQNAEPRIYRQVEELVRLVSDLYGGALQRVATLAAERDPALMAALVDDELVASLLLVHGLHPDSLAARVETALAAVRPLLAGHAGDVELLDIDEGVGAVHLRLLGSCDGCPSSAVTLKSAVEQAIVEAAPEIVRIDVDPASEASDRGPVAGVPVSLVTKPAFTECPTQPPAQPVDA